MSSRGRLSLPRSKGYAGQGSAATGIQALPRPLAARRVRGRQSEINALSLPGDRVSGSGPRAVDNCFHDVGALDRKIALAT